MNSLDNELEPMPAPAKSGAITKFFASAGGSTLDAFERAKPNHRQKRVTQGVLLFLVVLASSIVAGTAWAVPMGPAAGVLIAFIWFGIMFYLERSILQEMDLGAAVRMAKKMLEGDFNSIDKKGLAGITWLLVRIIMIIFIGYFNSEMVRVKMFTPEIVAEIKMRQDKQAAYISDSLHKEKVAIKKKVEMKEAALTRAEEALGLLIRDYEAKITACDDSIKFWTSKLPYEVKGPNGISGITGYGPVAKSIEATIARYQALKQDITTSMEKAGSESSEANTIRAYEKALKDERARAARDLIIVNKTEKALIKQMLDRPVNGLNFMVEVLDDIAGRSRMVWAVFFMFIFIEAIPVMLKYSSKSDSLVYILALEHMHTERDFLKGAKSAREEIENLKKPGPVNQS